MRYALLELESLRAKDVSLHEQNLLNIAQTYENRLKEQQAQHFIELKQCKDAYYHESSEVLASYHSLQHEYDDLSQKCLAYEQNLAQSNQEHNRLVSNHHHATEALKQLHVEAYQTLQRELSATHVQALDNAQVTIQELQAQITEKSVKYETLENAYQLLETKLNSETCLGCVTYKQAADDASTLYSDLQHKHNGMQDELLYYKQENARIEKQIALMKADLDKARAIASPDYRMMLKSEKEQSKEHTCT